MAPFIKEEPDAAERWKRKFKATGISFRIRRTGWNLIDDFNNKKWKYATAIVILKSNKHTVPNLFHQIVWYKFIEINR